MSYLARLKQIESNAPHPELTIPIKTTFGSFGGMGTGHIEKIFIDDAEIIVPPEPVEIAKQETLLEKQRASRREIVLTMLAAAPDTLRAVYPDTESDPLNVILAIAIRHIATFEMLIPKIKYDPWRLLELIERQGLARIAN